MAWWNSILSGIGAPQSQNNFNKFAAWNWAEDTTNSVSGLAINNPFNTTLPMSGSTRFNSANVQIYPSLQIGIAATISTLLHTWQGYAHCCPRNGSGTCYDCIVDNLRSDGPALAFAAAVGRTPWGTSGTNIGIKLATGNMTPAVGPGVGPTSGKAPGGTGNGSTTTTTPPPNTSTGCTTYTQAQLAGIWIEAGGPPQAAALASAIAMAESGGNSCAQGNNVGSVDRGLWQNNSKYNPSGSTFDVMANARGAISLWRSSGNSFKPWCTAWNGGCCSCGTYLGAGAPVMKFYNPSIKPDLTAPINPTQAVTPTGTPQTATTTSTSQSMPASAAGLWQTLQCALNPLPCVEQEITNTIDSMIGRILNPIIQLLAGILGLTAGTVLMIIGMLIIASETKTGQAAARTATRAGALASWAAGPEAGATSTIYESEAGKTVTTRTPGRKPIMGFGGKPGRVSSVRSYADRAPTEQIYETPAKGGGVQRTTITRNYDQGRVTSTKTTREVLRDEARKNAQGQPQPPNGNGG